MKTRWISCFVARIRLSLDSMLTASMGFVKIRTIAVLLSLSLSSSLVLWWITPPDYSFKGNKVYSFSIALEITIIFRVVCMMASTHYALVLSLHLEKVENCMRIKFIEGNFAVISGIYVRSCSSIISICQLALNLIKPKL